MGGNAGSAFGPLLAALIIQPLGQQSVSSYGMHHQLLHILSYPPFLTHRAAVAVGTLCLPCRFCRWHIGWWQYRYGRKRVIWGSILGAAPFALAMPYASLWGTIALAIINGLIISSAFSAIVVYATELMPAHVGVISGVFYGLMFGLGGVSSAFLGWLADQTSIELSSTSAHGFP